MKRVLTLALSLAVVAACVGLMIAAEPTKSCGGCGGCGGGAGCSSATADGCGGCSSSKTECAATCPVSGGEISKEAAIDYKGGKLYFCCAGCIPKFKSDAAKFQAKANAQLVLTGQAKQVGCPMSGKKLDPGTKTKVCGIEVCFCCKGCQEKVKSAAAEKQAEIVFVKGFDKSFKVKSEKDKK